MRRGDWRCDFTAILMTSAVLVFVDDLSVDKVWENMGVEIGGGDAKVPIEEIEKLFFHQVDFGERE